MGCESGQNNNDRHALYYIVAIQSFQFKLIYNSNLQQPLSTLMASLLETAEGQPWTCTRRYRAFIWQHVVKVSGQSVCYESAQDHRKTCRLFSWMAALNPAAEAAGIHICALLETVAVVAMSLSPGIWCWGSCSPFVLHVARQASCCGFQLLKKGATTKSLTGQTLSAFIPSAKSGKCV